MNNKYKSIVLDKTKPIYIGLDIHKEKWSLTVIHQEVVFDRQTLPGEVSELLRYLKRYRGFSLNTVYEAGFCGFYLHDELSRQGIRNLIVAPNKLPLEQGNKIKTDKRDSYKLAFYLSKGLLRGIDIPPSHIREGRYLLRARQSLIPKITALINQVKSLLHLQGIKLNCEGLPKYIIKELQNRQDLPASVKSILILRFETLLHLRSQVKTLEQQLEALMKGNRNYELLQTVPHLGPLLATTLELEIYNWHRFANEKQLCAYLGLTPSEFSSGDQIRRGPITGQGNPILRSQLIEASWRVIRKDPALKESYERIKAQTGSGKKAIVAIARKLMCRLRAMILKQESYVTGLAA